MLEANLKDVPFFSSLSKKELAEIARATDEIDVKQGKVLAREGDIGHEFFVILEGTAELVAASTDPGGEPIRFHDMRGYRLAEGLVMVKYTSDNGVRRSNRTSLWRRVGRRHWQIFHHQGTPTQQ